MSAGAPLYPQFPLTVICRGRRDEPHEPIEVHPQRVGTFTGFECPRCRFDVMLSPIDLHDLAKWSTTLLDMWVDGAP